MSEIIATRGSTEYLLAAKDGEGGVKRGQVLSLDVKRLFPPQSLDAILARGYWEAYKGSQAVLPDLMRQVRAFVPVVD